MAFEISAPGSQIVNPGASIVFSVNPVPCGSGLIYWRPGTGLIRLAAPSVIAGCSCSVVPWNCCGMLQADYDLDFHANIQIPEGGTAGSVLSLAVAIDGVTDPDSIMQSTPASPEEPENVGAGIVVSVPWICRCAAIQVINTSTVPVEVLNPNMKLNFEGVARRR